MTKTHGVRTMPVKRPSTESSYHSMDWPRLRRAVNRAMPEAEHLLSCGLDQEPAVAVLTSLDENNQQYQRARQVMTSHLEKHAQVDDGDAALLDDTLFCLEMNVAQTGFALGVAYGLLLNREAFQRRGDRR